MVAVSPLFVRAAGSARRSELRFWDRALMKAWYCSPLSVPPMERPLLESELGTSSWSMLSVVKPAAPGSEVANRGRVNNLGESPEAPPWSD